MSQLLMGLEEFNVAMARHQSRANRPTDRRSASMCPNRKNSGCAKNTIMREMSIDAAEAIAISKTVCPVEGMPTLLNSGMETMLRSAAAARHDSREDNDAQVACADDVFTRERQRCPITLPTVLIVETGQ